MKEGQRHFASRMAPALLLAFLAPMFAEVLPGATRFSSIFVFPIEMAVWGGGAVMARAIVRKRRLGWCSLLLLGVALALAEEFLIQQTSTAPLVIRLKGETWGRAFDLNYVYLIWALAYETVWVVILPTLTVEMIFPARQTEPWLNRVGAIITAILFSIGCFLAWFSWTQIARTKVFHQSPYTSPLHWIVFAVIAIAILVLAALRIGAKEPRNVLEPPAPWLIAIPGAIWAVLWFGLVVLAFGIAPQLSAPAIASAALIMIVLLLYFVPRWTAHPSWSRRHDYAVLTGSLLGSMAVSFAGFVDAAPKDLWFKVGVDLTALIGLIWLRPRAASEN